MPTFSKTFTKFLSSFNPWNYKNILTALAISQTLGFAYAIAVIEARQSNFFLVGLAVTRGMFLGAALAFGLAVSSHSVPKAKKRAAQILGWIAVAGLMLVAPVIMAPVYMATMSEDVRQYLTPFFQWSLSIGLAIAPDFVIVAVASNSGKLETEAPKPEVETVKPVKAQIAEKKPALREWLFANAALYTCKATACDFSAVQEADRSGRIAKWSTTADAKASLTKMLSGHQRKHAAATSK